MKTLTFDLPSTTKLTRGGFIQEVINEIVIACKENGYHISESNAYWAWRQFSRHMKSHWTYPPEDKEQLFKIVKEYCEEVE